MKVLIIGLGLIGGSYAMSLSKNGYEVYGVDQQENAIQFALERGWICDGSKEPDKFLAQADLILLAIYPQAILRFLAQYQSYFREGQIITDVCGVKTSFIKEATRLAGNAVYCSHHPMAGKEMVGITYADARIFYNANFLITPLPQTPASAVTCLQKLATDMGFGKCSVITPEHHDEMIGFTSQLTHAIAVSLVNSDQSEETKNFIGDSYRDLTRIAKINETLWSELFLENKSALLKHIENFEKELDVLKDALNANDKEKLNLLFKKSTNKRKEMEK